MDKIRNSKIVKWLVFIFIGFILLFFVDRLVGSYYQLKSVGIQNKTREVQKEMEDKANSHNLYYLNLDSLLNLNQHQKAIKLAQSRINVYPEDLAYITRDIGNIYYHKNNIDSAIIKYTEAISYTNLYITAYVDRGWAYYESDSLNLAIKDFQFAATHNWDFYYDLGLAQEKKGLLDSALVSYNNYLEHYPTNQSCKNRRDSIKSIVIIN